MLTENQVIAFVCRHLRSLGYEVTQELNTTQRGRDIVAKTAGAAPTELQIEAKGATSDRQGSARFGRPFDSAQVRDHVANAFYGAARMLESKSQQ